MHSIVKPERENYKIVTCSVVLKSAMQKSNIWRVQIIRDDDYDELVVSIMWNLVYAFSLICLYDRQLHPVTGT